LKEKLFRLEIRHQQEPSAKKNIRENAPRLSKSCETWSGAEQWPPRQSAKSVCNLKK